MDISSELASKKRHSYNVQLKQKAVDYAEKHSNRAAGRKFSVDESMVRRWRKEKTSLAKLPREAKSMRGGKPHWPQLEADLKEFVLGEAGRGLSAVGIRARAKEMARDQGITDFIGGTAWCHRFMRRIGLSDRTTVVQQLPDNWEELMKSFVSFTEQSITRLALTDDEIINMDEVPMTFDASIICTVTKKGASTTTGQEKTSFTVVLACTASGRKLEPMVIFKRLTVPKEKLPSGVVVVCNKKGCMNRDVMEEWAEKCYCGRPGAVVSKAAMLVLDSMTIHKDERIMEMFQTKYNTTLRIIPDGLTRKLQPLDIAINRAFKQHIWNAREEWMAEGLHSNMATGRMQQATHAEVCDWVLGAWEAVKPSTIIVGFIKAKVIRGLEEERAVLSVAVDDSAVNDSAVDDSVVDDSAVDNSAVDDSAVDDSAELGEDLAALLNSVSEDSDLKKERSDCADVKTSIPLPCPNCDDK